MNSCMWSISSSHFWSWRAHQTISTLVDTGLESRAGTRKVACVRSNGKSSSTSCTMKHVLWNMTKAPQFWVSWCILPRKQSKWSMVSEPLPPGYFWWWPLRHHNDTIQPYHLPVSYKGRCGYVGFHICLWECWVPVYKEFHCQWQAWRWLPNDKGCSQKWTMRLQLHSWSEACAIWDT